jgi:hypothetical protein
MAWPRLGWEDPFSKGDMARHREIFSSRLRLMLSSGSRVEDQDPAEVEARIRNISHGVGRDAPTAAGGDPPGSND